jgi:hypothetical protein
MSLGKVYLESILKRLKYYKDLGDKTFNQLADAEFFYQPNRECNSVAFSIQHMAGNMLSRFTDFLTTDGEKDWRNRDMEFEDQSLTKQQLIELWEKGWHRCLASISSLDEDDLLKTTTIRGESHMVVDALNRQLAHYPYHVGQIVLVGKLLRGSDWITLSIPRGGSEAFNQSMR